MTKIVSFVELSVYSPALTTNVDILQLFTKVNKTSRQRTAAENHPSCVFAETLINVQYLLTSKNENETKRNEM